MLVGSRRIRHRRVQRLELVMQIADAPAAGNRLVEDAAAGHLLHVLAEVADRQPSRDGDVAFVGLLFADDHPEQRRLARAVRADEADFLARIELERGVDEENLPAVLLADVGERNHRIQSTKLATATPRLRRDRRDRGTARSLHRSFGTTTESDDAMKTGGIPAT